MDIIFYTNKSDDDSIGKNIEYSSTLTGTLKEPCSLENPSITIEHSGVLNANYCYIAEFGRFYFISNQTILSNSRVLVEMSVDVLESFKNEILNLQVIIENSSTNNEKYLSSSLWVAKQKTFTDIINFPYGLNNTGEFILITAGG